MSELDTNIIHTDDAFDALPTLPEGSVHAVVTDPPYGLAFMGRDWDDFQPKEYQEWCGEWARECMRVLRPGGHLLAFSGNRTHHRLFTGVEDAGFEVRDTVTWHYGSGFPKALDVSKAIDKAEGVEREVTGTSMGDAAMRGDNFNQSDGDADNWTEIERWDKPATDAAQRWDGFKTALKPATEYVIVARKPLAEDTVAENVQAWGTGALNIGECRIDGGERPSRNNTRTHPENESIYGQCDGGGGRADGTTTEGRYPSNVVFDEDAARELDGTVGDKPSCDPHTLSDKGERSVYSNDAPNERQVGYPDSGGPSRYFYTSKASKSERTEGGSIQNGHPTVKPVDLMEWLVKLTTREEQIVLDPFAGSGTTLKAAKTLGREFIGVERQAEYADVARARVGMTPRDPSHVRAEDSQEGLEAFSDPNA